jgi:hypothetical protein
MLEGWCAVMIAALCFIVGRRRRRLGRHGVTTTSVGFADQPSEHENASGPPGVGSDRTEKYYIILHQGTLSGETLVQEPPRAYIPSHVLGSPDGDPRISAESPRCHCALLKPLPCPRNEWGHWFAN